MSRELIEDILRELKIFTAETVRSALESMGIKVPEVNAQQRERQQKNEEEQRQKAEQELKDLREIQLIEEQIQVAQEIEEQWQRAADQIQRKEKEGEHKEKEGEQLQLLQQTQTRQLQRRQEEEDKRAAEQIQRREEEERQRQRKREKSVKEAEDLQWKLQLQEIKRVDEEQKRQEEEERQRQARIKQKLAEERLEQERKQKGKEKLIKRLERKLSSVFKERGRKKQQKIHKIAKKESEEEECSICLAGPAITMICCGNKICSACLEDWVKTRVKDSESVDCPGCLTKLWYIDVCHILKDLPQHADLYRNNLSKVSKTTYTNIYCANKFCSAELGVGGFQFAKCYKCGEKTCTKHGGKAIPVCEQKAAGFMETISRFIFKTPEKHYCCEEHTGTHELLKQSKTKGKIKECPKCNKQWGDPFECQHVTCQKNLGGCGFEWCWACRADYDVIRNSDNSNHESSCPYHTKNLLLNLKDPEK